ncbi:MAG: YihY/virulence factor BrkB family protein, partial [Armatimonadota bacterium]|nr:YihY/virulence factor BrkB family protein [Armatimonadota bacterium]
MIHTLLLKVTETVRTLYRTNQQAMTHFGHFIWRIYTGYTRNGGALTAAAISYYALVSVVPLILLAVSLFGFFLGAKGGYQETFRVLSMWAPNPRDIVHFLRDNHVFDDINDNKSLTGLVGLGVMFWIGSQFFHIMEGALNRTWCSVGNRPFWKGRLMAFG